jgi:hypothetical protein
MIIKNKEQNHRDSYSNLTLTKCPLCAGHFPSCSQYPCELAIFPPIFEETESWEDTFPGDFDWFKVTQSQDSNLGLLFSVSQVLSAHAAIS